MLRRIFSRKSKGSKVFPESNAITGAQYLMMPVSELEFLHRVIKDLKAVLASHLIDRDQSVSEILSGLEPRWICQSELSDLRETIRVLAVEEIPVPADEQLDLVKRWIADGGG